MRRLLQLAGVLLIAACATAAPDPDAPQGELDIRVHNNLVPPATLTISLAPLSGIERNLGQAFSSRTTGFRYRGIAPKGQYRLIARATDNRAMGSDIIVLDGVLALEWQLNSNRVTITRTVND